MRFTKMEGLGNDYLYVYGEVPGNAAELSRRLSDRHFGPGADGMIFISDSETADFSMRIFNADGSEAMMCGNGIRCVGKYVYDKGYTDKRILRIDTLSGIRTLRLFVRGGKVKNAAVDMGKVEVFKDKLLTVENTEYNYTYVSVGNPHAVVFVDDIDKVRPEKSGKLIENSIDSTGGINVEFVQPVSRNKLRVKVWERGSGVTLACGTGACAASAAAVTRGICEFDSPISVILDGGILDICIDRDHRASMTGPANTVYEGETDIC